ncbi:hypothetical protein XNC1_0573 [Xenorhabdus nematophila ATCC 19061]|uniref:Uncharacterized protein n=1 Tax=Xenorhabdus nematophila (strain ATCC 19061 / DSM 3370 / CCUG 14189 / LMG 1036 / NCIMB 9965 / AN6) TaxID=406817 RepID=D3VIU7_XENNA|nr:hypothetical protein XNC1_0573 [Xenorhabdus nematophila ATCC 19061]
MIWQEKDNVIYNKVLAYTRRLSSCRFVGCILKSIGYRTLRQVGYIGKSRR